MLKPAILMQRAVMRRCSLVEKDTKLGEHADARTLPRRAAWKRT
jgi:hypothetical protein